MCTERKATGLFVLADFLCDNGIKSDISKVMYQMKCMDPLHASPTVDLLDPNQTSKMLVVIQIQTVRHTYGIGWYFKYRHRS